MTNDYDDDNPPPDPPENCPPPRCHPSHHRSRYPPCDPIAVRTTASSRKNSNSKSRLSSVGLLNELNYFFLGFDSRFVSTGAS